ncbi:MAG: hypothetical protein HONBIEJF_02551 [Fimbriimonadaceae bacterium]|nr:hypothetical protein [Fimbriimonadaceae bacterium]
MRRPVNGIERSWRGSNSGGSKRNSSSGIYTQLQSRLESMSFQSVRTLVFLWLSAKGYRNVLVLKRSGSRGRRSHGGPDFLARSPHHPRSRVAVQIRYWKTPVQRRVVDELRGYMLREGIREGLIVTNSSILPAARRSARDLETKPVRLFSSAQLAGSMASLGLGVEKVEGSYVVADWFFRGLDQIQLGHSLIGPKTLANCVRGRVEESVAGPRFGDQWPEGIVWLVLTVLLVLLFTLVFGASR